MTPDEYVKGRLDDQIDWLDRKSGQNQRLYARMTLAQIAGASAIPVLVALDAKAYPWARIVAAVLGALVAVLASIVAVMRYQAKWIEYRATCELLKREKYMYLTRVVPYDGNDAFAQLVARVEGALAKENASWARTMHTPALDVKA